MPRSPGSTVVVRNGQTGLTRTVSTNREGEFSIRNLDVLRADARTYFEIRAGVKYTF